MPDYRNIVHTPGGCEHCFVFADYMAHLFTYAIHLYPDKAANNEVYLICGDKYKVAAISFSAFMDLYLNDAEELKMI